MTSESTVGRASDDATVEGSLLDGAVQGAEAVRSIVVGGDKMTVAFGTNLVNSDYIRVIERRCGMGLLLEAPQPVFVHPALVRRYTKNYPQ